MILLITYMFDMEKRIVHLFMSDFQK